VDVTETLLPGVGIRYEFRTAGGTGIGVIASRDGAIELVVYDADDPDVCTGMLALAPDEAETLGELLGAPRLVERFADLTREVPGLDSDRVELAPGSPFDGRTLGDTRARTVTGTSVVAVVRGQEIITSPEPSQGLAAGDVVVAVGTDSGLAALRRLLTEGTVA
jgi:TrkA domain protein